MLNRQGNIDTLESSVNRLLERLFDRYVSRDITDEELKLLVAGLVVSGDEKIDTLEEDILSDSDLRRVVVIMEHFSKGR